MQGPLGYELRAAENIGCVPPPPTFNSVSLHYQIKVSASGPVTPAFKVTIPGGTQCPNDILLMGDWSVDRATGTGKPDWIVLTTPEKSPYTPITFIHNHRNRERVHRAPNPGRDWPLLSTREILLPSE
jgi:hypothetical protein